MNTNKRITMKDGTIVPAKSPVEWIPEHPSRCKVFSSQSNKWYTVRVTTAFESPDMDDLEYWTFDGVAESISGESVEPDGWAADGSPSWLLALELI